MTEPFFFEIPIYRCRQSAHTAMMKQEEEKIANPAYKDVAPESYQNAYRFFHKSLWYGWRYNEVIGYLNLYIMGSQFRGDSWMVKKARFNKGIVKKKFEYIGKEFEKEIPRDLDSAGIYSFMMEVLAGVQKREFKKRQFDLKTFKVIAPFVDWKTLTQQLNSYSYPEHRRKYFDEEG